MPVTPLKVLVLDPDIEAWQRQPGETLLRFNQFTAYRDLGRTRTLRKVAETLTLNDSYVRQISRAGQWPARAEQYDLDRDRQHDAEWLEARRAAHDRDARLLNGALAIVAQRLNTLRAEELEVPDLLRALDVVMRHRRTLFGDPQLTVAVTGPGGNDPVTVQLAELAGMGAERRQAAILALTDSVRRRALAAGTDVAAGDDDA